MSGVFNRAIFNRAISIGRHSDQLAHHGGNDNGRLPVTFDQFVEFGIHGRSIAPHAGTGTTSISSGRKGVGLRWVRFGQNSWIRFVVLTHQFNILADVDTTTLSVDDA